MSFIQNPNNPGGGGPGSVYSTDIVDSTAAGRSVLTAADAAAQVSLLGVDTLLDLKVDLADVGAASGVASLDAGGKVPTAQLPAALTGALANQGPWNAATNTPTLSVSPGTTGDFYLVTVAGTFDSISYAVGDLIVSNDTSWFKIDNSQVVTSVHGRVGAVVAQSGDYTTDEVTEGTNQYHTAARVRNTVLTGLNLADSTDVDATDTVLEALGKLQAQMDAGGPSGAPDDASYVVLGINGTLTSERVLTAGTAIDITDAGAGSTVTIDFDIQEVDFSALTAIGTVDTANDFLLISDESASGAVRKVAPADLGISGGGGSFSGAVWCGLASQTIGTGAWTTVNPSSVTELFDTDAYHDNTTNKERMTVPSGVAYVELAFRAAWANNATGDRIARILHYNSSSVLQSYVGYISSTPTAGAAYFNVVSRPVAVTAGDYFIVQVYQSSGGNLALYLYDTSASAEQYGWVAIKKLG